MKFKTTVTFSIATAILFGACNYSNQPNTSTINPALPSANVSPTPTPSKSLNELNLELDSTVDDGGKAELNTLQKDSAGL